MTNRELFYATMAGENGGDLLHFEQGFNVPYKKWYSQGMPAHVVSAGDKLSEYENLHDHFNVSGLLSASPNINYFCFPHYDSKLLDDDGTRITYKDGNGNTFRELHDSVKQKGEDGSSVGSPPYEVDFAIKNRKDYFAARDRYIGNIDSRYDEQSLIKSAEKMKGQNDFISSLFVHGPYAYLRVLIGTEEAMAAPYEDRQWVLTMLRDHLETCMGITEKIAAHYRFDASFVWEDCCGKTGPFISPLLFDDVFAWWYKEWKDFTKSIGVPYTILDTDGNPSPLVRQWYESGIDVMLPWEVNGVDMLKFAEEFPKYRMIGGIYKHMFEPNDPSQVGRFATTDVYEAIDLELKRVVAPMRKRGYYVAALDHGAHHAIEYPAYKYYCEKMYEYGKKNVVTRTFKKG
ncbi:MAG: hypothetical protein FWE82_01620 [Defluviitaleaceae bacterium]|nr:hypothetical protein [Defluviitaleaceae bacterium]